jgi:hypothetical protein
LWLIWPGRHNILVPAGAKIAGGEPGTHNHRPVSMGFHPFRGTTGIVHDRKLMREVRVNLAIGWFAGYALHEKLA